MTAVARVVAQAKINLLLRVLARETSGYHSIETIFLRIDLGDGITVRVGGTNRSVDCAGPAMPAGGLGPPEQNLAYRAAVAYAFATGWPNGFAIEIDKRVPVGGGLGGGSADAGAVLRALDALAPNALGRRLPELGAELGADVAFFTLESSRALAWGRGERLLPLAPLASRQVILAVPDFPVATADAYGWLSSGRGPYVPRGAVLNPDALATWEEIAALATNDFEAAVAARFPVVHRVLDAFRTRGADVALLSGSGATMFGVFAEDADAANLASETGVQMVETRTSERVVRVETSR
jgi:4-diphosphocytidyl-2-C-methyl-D-erythritol kinase